MSISPAACGELKPEICANLRLLIKVFVAGETPTPPVNLPTTKRKPLALCVEQGVFVFSQTPVFRIQTRVLRMSHESGRLAPLGAFPASL